MVALILGFFQGAVRMIIVMIMAYIGLIIAGLYFQTIGDWLHLAANIGLLESYSVAYVTVFILCMLTLSSMGIYTFRFFRGNTESIANRTIGLVCSVTTVLLLLGVLAHLLLILPIDGIASDVRSFISTDILRTVAAARFAEPLSTTVAPIVLQILDPFVFSDINQLFSIPTP
jgi:membrane protein required for colicin V production